MALMRMILAAVTLAACATPARAHGMDVFAPFIGCWRGEFEGQSDVHDERCFERNGAYVRDVHHVRPTDYSGESIYYADAEAGGLAYAYFASDGGRSQGAVSPNGTAVTFEPHWYVSPSGERQLLRANWRLIDANHYEVLTEREEGGAWRPLMRIVYAREEAGQ